MYVHVMFCGQFVDGLYVLVPSCSLLNGVVASEARSYAPRLCIIIE